MKGRKVSAHDSSIQKVRQACTHAGAIFNDIWVMEVLISMFIHCTVLMSNASLSVWCCCAASGPPSSTKGVGNDHVTSTSGTQANGVQKAANGHAQQAADGPISATKARIAAATALSAAAVSPSNIFIPVRVLLELQRGAWDLTYQANILCSDLFCAFGMCRSSEI